MKHVVLLLFALAIPRLIFSQETPGKTDTLRKEALNVYMEATDYIRREIPYVNYVRDIGDAAVYVISTSQRTGSGGNEYTYFLVGQNRFSGMNDTISFVTTPDETPEGFRMKEVNTLKMGLMRFVAKTPLSRFINISFTAPLTQTVSTDRWNSWVFKGSMNGYLNGEKTYKSHYISGNLSAARITEAWKMNFSTNMNTNHSKYLIEDETIRSSSESASASALIVKSLSDHWSVGGSLRVGSSSYSNQKFGFNVMPGIEYDLFPYSESTRRQLRVLYSAGFKREHYRDTTIYNKTRENLWVHSLETSYEVVQKWGSIDCSIEYANYLHDWSKNNISFNGYLNLRIAKGLSFTFGGGASLIHDQLSLVKADLSYDEILLQRRQMATNYEYFTSFGITYTFGSIYNNVVNPRFGNSGGGGMTIIMN